MLRLGLDSPATASGLSFDSGGVAIHTQEDGSVVIVNISRDTPERILLRALHDGVQIWKCIVWIVAAEVMATDADYGFQVYRRHYPSGYWTTISLSPAIYFKFKIFPASILAIDDAESDVPDLRGANTLPPPNPPDRVAHILSGRPFSTGADRKWDVSRRMRMKLLNPALVASDVFRPAEFTAVQPVLEQIVTDFPPADFDAVGNDDTLSPSHANGAAIQSNNPYVTSGKVGMWNQDRPELPLRNDVGYDGNVIEQRVHFGEFARLQLGNRWQRISEFFPWRIHFRLRRNHGQWEDHGSGFSFDNNGF